MAPPQGDAAHSSTGLFSRGVVVTMYPDRAARQVVLEASKEGSKDRQNPRMAPLERKSGGSVTSELMREEFSREGCSGGVSRAGSTYRGAPHMHGSAALPHSSTGPLTGSLWGARVPARGENHVVHATVGDLVQVCSIAPCMKRNEVLVFSVSVLLAVWV